MSKTVAGCSRGSTLGGGTNEIIRTILQVGCCVVVMDFMGTAC